VNPNHRDKEQARARRQAEGGSYSAHLQELRRERLEHRDRVQQEHFAEEVLHAEDPVPPELPLLVRHHIDEINRHFYDALMHGYRAHSYGEWARIALFRLTDALELLHLTIGTAVAHLQSNHINADRIRDCVQARNHKDVEAFVTRQATHCLAGLTGSRRGPGGRRVTIREKLTEAMVLGETDGHVDVMEAFLAALYSSYPYDAQAFDMLPPETKSCALQAAQLALAVSAPDGHAGSAEVPGTT